LLLKLKDGLRLEKPSRSFDDNVPLSFFGGIESICLQVYQVMLGAWEMMADDRPTMALLWRMV
jgi:hypothetical protein